MPKHLVQTGQERLLDRDPASSTSCRADARQFETRNLDAGRRTLFSFQRTPVAASCGRQPPKSTHLDRTCQRPSLGPRGPRASRHVRRVTYLRDALARASPGRLSSPRHFTPERNPKICQRTRPGLRRSPGGKTSPGVTRPCGSPLGGLPAASGSYAGLHTAVKPRKQVPTGGANSDPNSLNIEAIRI